jgi:uncharacterized protein (DUF302 family)
LATRKFVAMIAGIWLWGVCAMTADGLATLLSSFGPKETMDRLEAEIKAKGIVFARNDHAAGAVEAGLLLRPTELLIFGSAKAGTPLMQANQAIGIDLPLKALVLEVAAGKVWVAKRHGLGAAVAHRPSMRWRAQRCCGKSNEITVSPRDHDERGAP